MHASAKMSFKKILIAVDESAFGERAAEVGIALAESLNAEIAFVYAYDPASAPGTMWGVPADRTMEMSEQAGKHLLASFRGRTTSGSTVPDFLVAGPPAAEILDVAKKWHADLIVMGSHGRGRVGGLILGSVSTAVLHHAPCPVLVVRAQP